MNSSQNASGAAEDSDNRPATHDLTPVQQIASRYGIDATPADMFIAEEIDRTGPISFARFMELALYDPLVGYYAQQSAGPGAEGDYVTSPELHPAFGVLLGTQFEEMWRHLGRPSVFWVIEGGPGTGRFAATVLESTAALFPDLFAAMHYGLLERSPRLRAAQALRLASWGDRVHWLPDNPDEWTLLGPGVVFANELLDALPVHRIMMQPIGLRELHVTAEAGRLVQRPFQPVSRTILAQLAGGGAQLRAGDQGEVNLLAPAWVAAASRLVEPGFMLLVDYGASATDLYGAEHPAGTLRCYYRHTMTTDPFIRIGRQDLTAHVDFSAVSRAAEAADWTMVGATHQDALLGRLGLSTIFVHSARLSLPGRRAHEAALHLLGGAKGLGRLMAVAFAKGVASISLSGFERSRPLDPPLPDLLWRPTGLDPRLVVRAATEDASRTALSARDLGVDQG